MGKCGNLNYDHFETLINVWMKKIQQLLCVKYQTKNIFLSNLLILKESEKEKSSRSNFFINITVKTASRKSVRNFLCFQNKLWF